MHLDRPSWQKPYEDSPDQYLAILCQFQIFFCLISGMVLEIVPDSPLIDAVLSTMIILIGVMAVAVEMLDGLTIEEWIKMTLGFDDEENEATKDLQRANKKAGVVQKDGPIKQGFEMVKKPIVFVINKLLFILGKILWAVDWILGVPDQEKAIRDAREAREELHPEMRGQRHRLSSWRENQAELKKSVFAEELEAMEAEEEAISDEENAMTKEGKLDRMMAKVSLGPPDDGDGTGFGKGGGGRASSAGANFQYTGGARELDAFLNPERVGIEIALNDLEKSAKAAAKRAAKSLSNLVGATKGQMESDLKRIAADWPVVTPRGRHLTERYTAAAQKEADTKEALFAAAQEVYEVQRELRGIAFLSGAEMSDSGTDAGKMRPTDAAEWKALVAEMVNGTKSTAHSLRILQKVLDTMPESDDTNVLKATPAHHPHRQLITELGLAAGTTSSSLRALLSLAVAAGASPDVAPWSRFSKMHRELDKQVAKGPRGRGRVSDLAQESSRDQEPPSPDIRGADDKGGARRPSLDRRLALSAAGTSLQ